jgi:hypothetical protein
MHTKHAFESMPLAVSGRPMLLACGTLFMSRRHCSIPCQAGCNLWRNWDDIQCSWGSLSSIIDHWGDYTAPLQDSIRCSSNKGVRLPWCCSVLAAL